MMGDVTTRIVKVWLDSAIPPALKDVDKFQDVIKSAEQFCAVLDAHGYTGFEDLKNWVNNAPTIWLAKCRETALDSVRSKLSSGKCSLPGLESRSIFTDGSYRDW